ncbi:hypothetical protein NQ176_g8852 [Zarea fungicola]|uniref:Uncharacterized protein n=1 Tax=Zarea fungicola TaxID=93591 RepID=A0ACC1MS39_9HYPO|nr:hypothetical protein NQ176_g8852 [Lecanicillium fungicola]
MAASTFYAVIAGVGSGTGASVAQLFAKHYPVALLARSEANYAPVVEAINKAGGKAIGITTDAADSSSVGAAFAHIAKEWPEAKLAAAVYNANAGFAYKPFLELEATDLTTSLGTAA